MSSTTFINYKTPISAEWLNDVNTAVYGSSGTLYNVVYSGYLQGGSIQNTPISGSTGAFTTLNASDVSLFGGGANRRIQLSADTANTYAYSNGDYYFGATGANNIQFVTNNVVRASLDTSGNLGLGVTPSGWVNGTTGVVGKTLQGDSWGIASYLGVDGVDFATNVYNSAYAGVYKYRLTATATIYRQASGAHILLSAPSGTAGNTATFTQVLNVNKGTALTLEGGTSTAGTGIAFPATQLASTDPNTLDDYKEGTWTPNQGAGLTVVGAFSSSGTYTKIGRQVTVLGQVNGATSVALASPANLICTNLPFAIAGNLSTGTMVSVDGTKAGFIYGNGTTNVANSSTIAATSGIQFTLTYFV